MDSDNSESGKEEEDDDEDSNKTQANQLLDHEKTYLQMCQTSAKILQVLAGLGAPQTTHVIELESITDDSEDSSCSSPESMSQTSNTEEISRPESSECVIWAEPLMTCQIMTAGKQPCPDARRLPPGVTPDDVKRSKAEAAKTRGSVIASIEAEDKRNQSKKTESFNNRKFNFGEGSNAYGSSGTSDTIPGSSKTFSEISSTSTKSKALNSSIDPLMFKRTVTESQNTTVPSVDAVSSSLAATREDFRRAMSQISCASETIRQAHSLLTSMGLGHYSIRRRLSQMNNNNNPGITDPTEETTKPRQDTTPEQVSAIDTHTYTIIEEPSETESMENSSCKESESAATNSTSTFPPLLRVKPAQSETRNMYTGTCLVKKQSESKKELVSNGDQELSSSVKAKTSFSDAVKPSTFGKSLTGSNSAGDAGLLKKNDERANFRQFRDVCSATDNMTKWSSHLQPQRRMAFNQTSSVTRFTNRFMGQPRFSRNAPYLSRTEESTNLANNVQKSSAVSPVDEPKNEDTNCCNQSSNAYCASTRISLDGISKKQKIKDTKTQEQITRHGKAKHRITINDVKQAVELAVENLQKSGKWTDSLNNVTCSETEFNFDINLIDVTAKDKTGCGVRGNDDDGKKVTFLKEPVANSDSLTNDNGQIPEDTVCAPFTASCCVINDSSKSLKPLNQLTSFKNSINVDVPVKNLTTSTQAKGHSALEISFVSHNISNNKETEEFGEVNNTTTGSAMKLLVSDQSNVREGQGDTPESLVPQNNKSYFDRLKEICDNQSLTKTKEQSDTTKNNVHVALCNDQLVARVCDENHAHSKTIVKSQVIENKDGEKAVCESKHEDINTVCYPEQNQITKTDLTEILSLKIISPVGGGQQSVQGNRLVAVDNKNIDSNTPRAQQLEMPCRKKDTVVENVIPKDINIEVDVKEKQKGMDPLSEKADRWTLNNFGQKIETDCHSLASESVIQTESSAAANITFTSNSSTADHVFALVENEDAIWFVKQWNEDSNSQQMESKDEESVGSKTLTVVSPEPSTAGGDSNHADVSATPSNEEAYKPSFFVTSPNSSEINAPTTSSSSDKISAFFTCAPSLNLHPSFSAGDMCPEDIHKKKIPNTPENCFNARSASLLCKYSQTKSAFYHDQNQRPTNKTHARPKMSNLRPSSCGGEATNDPQYQSNFNSGKSKLAFDRQKYAKSASNSPRQLGHVAASKWNKVVKPIATKEILTTHSSSVSIIEMLEEHKPEPLILPEPSIAKDPFGIRQSAQAIVLDEERENVDTKVKTDNISTDSGDEFGDGENVKKFKCTSFFSRPGRLRFRRRRRRHRQRSNSWWSRSLRCMRSKLRSLFRPCLKRE